MGGVSVYRLLPIAYCLLPDTMDIAYCLLPIACCHLVRLSEENYVGNGAWDRTKTWELSLGQNKNILSQKLIQHIHVFTQKQFPTHISLRFKNIILSCATTPELRQSELRVVVANVDLN